MRTCQDIPFTRKLSLPKGFVTHSREWDFWFNEDWDSYLLCVNDIELVFGLFSYGVAVNNPWEISTVDRFCTRRDSNKDICEKASIRV